jgi:hypothetical protein
MLNDKGGSRKGAKTRRNGIHGGAHQAIENSEDRKIKDRKMKKGV